DEPGRYTGNRNGRGPVRDAPAALVHDTTPHSHFAEHVSGSMAISSYEEALSFWYRRVNFELSSPLPDDLRLERIRARLTLQGNPHQRLRIVHIAGSKGKGSTAAMLANILQHAGYRTGLFTSPHLSRVEERIQVDGKPISNRELTQLLAGVEKTLQ